MKKALRYLRWLWVGSAIVFMIWLFTSYQAQGFDKATALTSTANVTVSQSDDTMTFQPVESAMNVHFLLLPGAMVEPLAYAPLARSLAEQGISTTIMALPWRGAPVGFEKQAFFTRLLTLIETDTTTNWVIGGHSRGAALAAQFAHDHPDTVQGVVLLATTHPKDESANLSGSTLPVLKVYASNDEVASVSQIEANKRYLPDDTHYVLIEGGNHGQFGWYGAQLGDGSATISREVQQAQLLSVLVTFFQRWYEN